MIFELERGIWNLVMKNQDNNVYVSELSVW